MLSVCLDNASVNSTESWVEHFKMRLNGSGGENAACAWLCVSTRTPSHSQWATVKSARGQRHSEDPAYRCGNVLCQIVRQWPFAQKLPSALRWAKPTSANFPQISTFGFGWAKALLATLLNISGKQERRLNFDGFTNSPPFLQLSVQPWAGPQEGRQGSALSTSIPGGTACGAASHNFWGCFSLWHWHRPPLSTGWLLVRMFGNGLGEAAKVKCVLTLGARRLGEKVKLTLKHTLAH